MKLACTLLLGLCASLAQAQDAPGPPAEPEAPLRRFQADDFRLAYDVFLGNAQLEPALRVARQAVRERPADRDWRRRLAQVAEWLARTDIAAEQWRALFAMGDRSPDTLVALLRLAPALDDPTSALPAWLYLAEQGPLSAQQWNDIFWLFETSSEPQRGSRFFEAQYRQRQLPLLLDLAARLAAHGGDEDRALALYTERLQLEPLDPETLVQAVFIRLRRDQLDEAVALMRQHMHRVPDQELDFWRLLGQVAWETRDYAVSQQAYARSVDAPGAELGDWSRLIFLTRQQQPQRAAELALLAWHRFGQLEQLLLALEIHAERGETAAQARIYAGLDPQQRSLAEENLTFLLGRAQFHQRRRELTLAWADLRRAQRLAPRDDTTTITTLWFLIEAGWQRELEQALAQHQPRAQGAPAYWPAYAAGRLVLGQARQSARWYRMALARTPDDALLLAGYADALDPQGLTGMADRVRRQAWQQLATLRAGRSDLGELMRRPEFQTWVRLSLNNRPGDPSQALMRQLLAQFRGADPELLAPAGRDELVLAWALTRELPESARHWMLQRYALARRPAPVWAEAQLAQLQQDRPRMAQLLQGRDQMLPPTSRIDLALATGQTPLAIDTAFRNMARESDAAALHEHFRQQAPKQAHYLQLRTFQDKLGQLERLGSELEARLVLSQQLHLYLGWSQVRQSSSDADYATLLPGSDRIDKAELRWLERERETRAVLTRRTELASYNGLSLQHRGRWMHRLAYELELDHRGTSELSLPLRAAGYESGLQGALTYTLDKRNYLRASPRLSRYYTQYDDYLGSGTSVELEAGHHFRNTYPDWRARLYLQNRAYSRDGGLSPQTLQRLPAYLQTSITAGTIDAVGYFIPQDSTTVGACLAVGDNLSGLSLQNDYSRAWRPYADVCLTNNSVVGEGYITTLGVAGPIRGPDHLAIQFLNSDGTVPGSASLSTLSIRYRHYF
ncbi:MAG: tetratricopeptide repeat protein [Hylemonella sp.]|nr:tetratricopeptide repeat protein [Hylemonella sp.]